MGTAKSRAIVFAALSAALALALAVVAGVVIVLRPSAAKNGGRLRSVSLNADGTLAAVITGLGNELRVLDLRGDRSGFPRKIPIQQGGFRPYPEIFSHSGD